MENIDLERLRRDLNETKVLMLRNAQFEAIDPFLQNLLGLNTFNADNEYDSLYSSATEDMRTYYKAFNKPKSFLSIGASGEQVANAINSGATIIDVYDSNRLCRYAVSLRLAAIKALTKEELFHFYDTFDEKLFAKLADELDELTLNYWGNLYLMFRENAPSIIRETLFTYKRLDKSLILTMNPYLDDYNYSQMKDKINSSQVTFYDSDLYSLPSVLTNQTYDAMTLSNIYEYLNYGRNISRQKAVQYRNFVINSLLPRLNPNGTIMVSYLYSFNEKLKKDFDQMYQKEPDKIVPSGAMTLEQYPYYMQGLTTQNLSYSLLLDAFKDDNLSLIPTSHIEFGQSKDMSHDLALCLKR